MGVICSKSANKQATEAVELAASGGQIDVVKEFLDSGGSPDARSYFRFTNSHGRTLLAEAAGKGRVEMVQFLVDRGAKVNLKKDGETAMSWTCSTGNHTGVQALIESKADLEDRVQGKTPLLIACEHGRLDVVRVLVEAGARKDVVDLLKRTPLKLAVDAQQNDSRKLTAYLVATPGFVQG